MESDLKTLVSISKVSKYWNYLSKMDVVRDTVYKVILYYKYKYQM